MAKKTENEIPIIDGKPLNVCIKSDRSDETAKKILSFFESKGVTNHYFHYSGREGGYGFAHVTPKGVNVFCMWNVIPDGYVLTTLEEIESMN